MCFAPQPGALFRHLNIQKWSETASFFGFSLRHVLRTTPARTFWTSQLPKVLRASGAFDILTWKCAWRRSSVHFFHLSSPQMAPHAPAVLASLLFDRPEPQSIGQNIAPRLLLLSSLLFSHSSRLCWTSVNIVGSLTSKLLSVNHISWPNCMILPIRDPHPLVMSPTCWPLRQVTTHGIRPDLAAQHVLEQLQNLQLWQLWPFADLWGGNGRYQFFMIFYGSFSYNDIHNANV